MNRLIRERKNRYLLLGLILSIASLYILLYAMVQACIGEPLASCLPRIALLLAATLLLATLLIATRRLERLEEARKK